MVGFCEKMTPAMLLAVSSTAPEPNLPFPNFDVQHRRATYIRTLDKTTSAHLRVQA